MIPQGTLETEELIGTLVASAKNAVNLAADSLDRKLQAGVRELYDSAIQVGRRLVELEQENRLLREELDNQAKTVQPEKVGADLLNVNEPDSPLCPKCLQSVPSTAVALIPSRDSHGAKVLSCSICGYHQFETAQWSLWNTGEFAPFLKEEKQNL